MTLTTVLPSLRRSIPDPIERRAWPEHTVAEVRDVTVAGVSLTRLAQLEGTPCVMTGDLAHPHTQDARRRGIGMDVTVLVFRVTLRVDSQDARRLALVDCATHDLPIQWEHCRLIGRASTAKTAMVDIVPGDVGAPAWPYIQASLPTDLVEGDLLAVPCTGALALRDVKPGRAAQDAGTSPDADEPDENCAGRCGK
ncbi:hypothetical protein ACH0CG_05310 [Microbacterium sp. 179-I 1D1 NHS]|uniref:hypothetical protein n=1 Tax=Microbacterium sp. 179-I 1D1 NHS TaxID=3374298 RepID=UPI00387979D9